MKIITREAALDHAKAAVGDGDGRKWLIGRAPDCYGSSGNYAEIHQLEGTPARGYIVDIGFGGGLTAQGMVMAFGLYGRRLLTIKYGVAYFHEREVVSKKQ